MRNDKRELTKSEDLFSWDVKDNLATLKKKNKKQNKTKKNKKVFLGGGIKQIVSVTIFYFRIFVSNLFIYD